MEKQRGVDRSQRMELSVAIPFEIVDKAPELKLSSASDDNTSNSVASQFVSLQSNQRASDQEAPRATQQLFLENEVTHFSFHFVTDQWVSYLENSS